MTKKQNKKYDIYEDKEDAFLSGHSEGVDNAIYTLIQFMALDENFLHMVLRDFISKNKDDKKWDDV